MPRRSRPSYRLPPNKGKKEELENVLSKPKLSKTRFVEKAEDSEEEAGFDEDVFEEEGSSQRSEGELGVSDDEEFDADAPRVAVWEEDNEEFLTQDVEENKPSDEVCVPVLVFLQPQAYAKDNFYRIGCRMVRKPTFLARN